MITYLIVLFLILLINAIPASKKVRSDILLPFSFFILWLFLAFRYNYGLDYMSYYDLFNNLKHEDLQTSEFIFWKFFYLFDRYYQVIIAHTTIICITLFYFVRRYLPPRYYAFFFFVFMCHPGLFFNYVSALRSSLASMAFLWCVEFFYVRKKRILFFTIFIVLISYIHKSALFLLAVPAVEIIQSRLHPNKWVWFLVFGIATIISVTSVSEYVSWVIDAEYIDNRYAMYIEQDKFYNSTYKNLIIRAFMIVPAIYIVNALYAKEIASGWYRIIIIAISFFVVYFVGLDFQHRLTVLSYIVCLFAIIYVIQETNRHAKYWIVSLTICFVLLQSFLAFRGLRGQLFLSGNYWFYDSLLTKPLEMWP